MFVRKDKDGNLVAVGSIDQSLLTQLQRESKKDSAKAESKAESKTPDVEPKPVVVESKPPAAEPKAKSSTSTSRS
jgi:hypothetical protein